MTGGRYAQGTEVPVDRSQQEIVRLFHRYRIDTYAFGAERGRASVAFEFQDMPIRVGIPVPTRPGAQKVRNPQTGRMVDAYARWEQEVKECWRALVLLLKANLEAVERGIVTVAEAFMAYLVAADGTQTLGEIFLPTYLEQRAQLALESGQ